MRRKEKFVHIALGSLVVMVGLLAMGSFSLAAEGTWATRTDMPTPRWDLSTSVVDGKIYAIGGAPRYNSVGLRTVEAYDPGTDTWTTKSEMPTARQALSTNVVNGKIYAIGGAPGGFSGVENLSTVEEYDPATDTWTTKSEMPTARGFHSASVVDGRIYLIGGSSSLPNEGTAILAVEVYEPATDSWTQKGDIARRRACGSTSVVDGKIYAFQGFGSGRWVGEYDPATDTWTQKADMPTSRVSLSTSVLDGKIYAIGGELPVSPYSAMANVEVYDPATDTWTIAPDMPTARWDPGLGVVDGKIYAIGGLEFPSPACGTVEQYDPARIVEVSPASAMVGQPTSLEVTVVLGRPLEETETLRLDLTSLGLPSDLPLEHVGGGRYTASTIVTPLRSGRCDLLILMETTEGKRYSFLTVTLDVYPGGDEYLYQDQMGPRWEVKVYKAELDLTASDIVHQGSYSQAINSSGGYVQYTCKDPDGFSTFGYTALEFWINPGTSSTEKAKFIPMTNEGFKYLKWRDDLGITLQPNVWQVVSIPLEDLELVDTRLRYIQFRYVEGTFYLDDLGFVVAEYRLAEAAASPEKVKADGTMPTTLTVQAVPVVPEPGAPPTVTVDLTPIGGEHDAVMVDDGTGGDKVAGDGIYTLQTIVGPEIQNGIKDLVITSTDTRLRVVRVHLPLAVLPTEDVYLYLDQVEAGWKLKLYKAETNPNSTEYVHSGSYAQAITLQTGGRVEYMVEDPDGLPTFGYATLEFWINPGSASIEELKIVAYRRFGESVATKIVRLVEQLGLSFEPEVWQQVSIPAEALELTDANLEKIRFTGDVQGTFYIDDMRLVAEEVEITAVEEVSEVTAVPLGYALSQNYPNPFNPQTTIRYDLAQAGAVRLSVYNVLGQMVRTLVDGQRSAGTYSVIWDGRDGTGQAMASGIYLYRLEVKGQYVQSRRMVLLR